MIIALLMVGTLSLTALYLLPLLLWLLFPMLRTTVTRNSLLFALVLTMLFVSMQAIILYTQILATIHA